MSSSAESWRPFVSFSRGVASCLAISLTMAVGLTQVALITVGLDRIVSEFLLSGIIGPNASPSVRIALLFTLTLLAYGIRSIPFVGHLALAACTFGFTTATLGTLLASLLALVVGMSGELVFFVIHILTRWQRKVLATRSRSSVNT